MRSPPGPPRRPRGGETARRRDAVCGAPAPHTPPQTLVRQHPGAACANHVHRIVRRARTPRSCPAHAPRDVDANVAVTPRVVECAVNAAASPAASPACAIHADCVVAVELCTVDVDAVHDPAPPAVFGAVRSFDVDTTPVVVGPVMRCSCGVEAAMPAAAGGCSADVAPSCAGGDVESAPVAAPSGELDGAGAASCDGSVDAAGGSWSAGAIVVVAVAVAVAVVVVVVAVVMLPMRRNLSSPRATTRLSLGGVRVRCLNILNPRPSGSSSMRSDTMSVNAASSSVNACDCSSTTAFT